MTVNLNALSPRQLKQAVREATYPNSEVERATIAAADSAADAVIARHTGLLNADAAERIEQGGSLLRVADELNSAMLHDVRAQLQSGANPTALAATYQRLETGVQKMVAELRQEAARAELLADRLESPEDDYERLIERLPALRRGIQW
ncbi:MAG: hypothetical protein RJQ01_06550 [Microcella sp.]|uniref:hypothetical protein n=1 Tax=Microcella sp. TaxID=1913979 RepID=UPI003314EE4A